MPLRGGVGIYWGVGTAFVRRSGFTFYPSPWLDVRSVPLPVGCGSAPPPPPPAGVVTVTNPGFQFNYKWDNASLQMRVTGLLCRRSLICQRPIAFTLNRGDHCGAYGVDARNGAQAEQTQEDVGCWAGGVLHHRVAREQSTGHDPVRDHGVQAADEVRRGV